MQLIRTLEAVEANIDNRVFCYFCAKGKQLVYTKPQDTL